LVHILPASRLVADKCVTALGCIATALYAAQDIESSEQAPAGALSRSIAPEEAEPEGIG
jgi:hypothetical protein